MVSRPQASTWRWTAEPIISATSTVPRTAWDASPAREMCSGRTPSVMGPGWTYFRARFACLASESSTRAFSRTTA